MTMFVIQVEGRFTISRLTAGTALDAVKALIEEDYEPTIEHNDELFTAEQFVRVFDA